MTERRERFADLYVSGPRGVQFNATRSAEAAGFAWPAKQGPRLLTVPEVAARVEALYFARLIEPEGPEMVELHHWLIEQERAGACRKK